eukprot:scaffold43755_cov22-Tisochrysis_lutea.AAC.1
MDALDCMHALPHYSSCHVFGKLWVYVSRALNNFLKVAPAVQGAARCMLVLSVCPLPWVLGVNLQSIGWLPGRGFAPLLEWSEHCMLAFPMHSCMVTSSGCAPSKRLTTSKGVLQHIGQLSIFALPLSFVQ